jgi:hypothetical protein
MYQQKSPIYQNSKAVRDMVLLLMAKAGGGQRSGQRTQQPTIYESGEGEQRLAMRV